MNTKRNLVIGALVGDAASLGLHWLYDQPRIAQLAGDTPEFCGTTAKDFEGVPAYFAHPLKRPGDLTQYGEQLMVLLRALAASGGTYDQTVYNAEFAAHFGYGGTYSGYIDHATRETLDNLAKGDADAPQGANDVQLPAIAKLPALVAAGQERHAADAVRTTNATEIADLYGAVATAMLIAARDGESKAQIAEAAVGAADPQILPRLDLARAATDRTNAEITSELGLACELENGVPSVLHNLLTAGSYKDAVRANIMSGGDSSGRAMLLGAVSGVLHGVPDDWAARLNSYASVKELLDRLKL
ncbi:ADP-ribosylglycohydrolase family protein [Rhodobacteraceae bacterium B1Z28]|uniref:ADP-ribosylglycohydrolase family protein n=1 Tax=Ruegeria haliotis TaxID=2747601 RepID=A0ABX2PS38_9RHOB|nr:ADP-ribosylglycohydrolase family protein [Ruegeria haliotis]NVO56998.1 ADP-ribosylglycohydrolase family protein [Ruegeria haliotis]